MPALLAAVLAPPVATQAPQTRIRVGTWNLEFFGNRRDAPRSDADIATVAGFIRGLGVDVLAVQEVGTPEALAKLARSLGPRWSTVLGTTGMWRDGSGGQRVGFVWNDERVALLHAEELLDLPREVEDAAVGRIPIFHRVPVCAVFRARTGGLDFRAVTVHLKADVRREIEAHGRDETSTRKRVAEVTALGEALRRMLARADEDQDVLVLGDFNHVLARDRATAPADAKAVADLRVPLLAHLPGFTRIAPADPRPTIRWFTDAIDHVVVGAGLREEVLAATVKVHLPTGSREPTEVELEAWQKVHSDHFPVTIDLDASVDRDPNAIFAPAEQKHELRPAGTAVAEEATPAPRARPQPTAERSVTTRATPPGEGTVRAGQHVELRTIGGHVFQGTLVGDLGEAWVHLDLDHGGLAAFPVRNIVAIVAK